MPKLTEIPEQGAPPGIAAIYAEMRQVTGLPLVNLIWRHFATTPEVFRWAWNAVAPVIASRSMKEATSRIASSLVLPPIDSVDAQVWQAAGVSVGDVPRITATIDAYIRGNLMNIVALTALRMRLDQPGRPAAQMQRAEASSISQAPVDPLPRIDALDPATAAGVRKLAKLHDGAEGYMIPSLYLALAYWPGVIEALPAWLAPLYEPEALHAARQQCCALAEAEAGAMLPPQSAPPEAIAIVRPALDAFTTSIIPSMVPVCIALRRLVPQNAF